MAMKGYSAFPKAPALLKPLHQIDQDADWVSLKLLQRCIRCILQPQPIGHLFFYWGLEYAKVKLTPHPKNSVSLYDIKLYLKGALESAEYSFMAITPSSTLSQSGSTCQGQIDLFLNHLC